MNKIKHFIEWQVFGVCTAIGEKMGIATSVIRKYFIYISFLTLGSPVIFYLFLAFWMNIKNYIQSSRRNPVRILVKAFFLIFKQKFLYKIFKPAKE